MTISDSEDEEELEISVPYAGNLGSISLEDCSDSDDDVMIIEEVRKKSHSITFPKFVDANRQRFFFRANSRFTCRVIPAVKSSTERRQNWK
jgi:hypothetical protein